MRLLVGLGVALSVAACATPQHHGQDVATLDAGAVAWPYVCLGISVDSWDHGEADGGLRVWAYGLPSRCVPELERLPGSRWSDGGCVPGCTHGVCCTYDCQWDEQPPPERDRWPWWTALFAPFFWLQR